MPRQGRSESKSGIYHVMVRGINRQNIFEDDEDRQKYLNIMQKTKEISQCKLYGYCLMDNHVHMLVREGKEKISQIMKRIGVSYAYWYNQKYERSGHLFQDRYRSESVEDDSYFLAVLRYIHQNPLKAKIVINIDEYLWSSYRAYLANKMRGLIDTEFVLGMFGVKNAEAIKEYIRFMSEESPFRYLEDKEKKKWTDDEIRGELAKLLEGRPLNNLNTIEKADRDKILKKLKAIEGISIRQIARITDFGRNIVANA